jgi:hypothetical protein
LKAELSENDARIQISFLFAMMMPVVPMFRSGQLGNLSCPEIGLHKQYPYANASVLLKLICGVSILLSECCWVYDKFPF